MRPKGAEQVLAYCSLFKIVDYERQQEQIADFERRSKMKHVNASASAF